MLLCPSQHIPFRDLSNKLTMQVFMAEVVPACLQWSEMLRTCFYGNTLKSISVS